MMGHNVIFTIVTITVTLRDRACKFLDEASRRFESKRFDFSGSQ